MNKVNASLSALEQPWKSKYSFKLKKYQTVQYRSCLLIINFCSQSGPKRGLEIR